MGTFCGKYELGLITASTPMHYVLWQMFEASNTFYLLCHICVLRPEDKKCQTQSASPWRAPTASLPTSAKSVALWKQWAQSLSWHFFPPCCFVVALFKEHESDEGYRCSTWLSCKGEEGKMAAHLMTEVKRLWRRQKSRTPWKHKRGGWVSDTVAKRDLYSIRLCPCNVTLDMTSCMSLLGW